LAAEWGFSENHRRAKYYRLTKAGERYLEAEHADWNRMVLAIGRIMEPA
jgi:DNA-binding PadR family transcriptional regulator